MTKYKYYFRKPKSEITKDILKVLLISGLFVIGASGSTRFMPALIRDFKRFRKYRKKRISNAFYNLKRKGYIIFNNKNGQLYISLTEKGKKKAGWMQIDALKIKKPKKWDRKWRLVMFDISQLKRLYREALRGKLKELGFQLFQKSVWITPYRCEDEIELLKSFFGLTDNEVKLITTQDIGNDRELRENFKLK